MLLFQKIEHLLKMIIANSKLEGYASELNSIQQDQSEKISKQTLGTLIGLYMNLYTSESYKEPAEPEDIESGYFSFNFQVCCDSTYPIAIAQRLKETVLERNELVHHLFPTFDDSSIESCQELAKKLDTQHQKTLQELDSLKTMAISLNEGRVQLAAFLGSEEGRSSLLLAWMKQNLISILCETSRDMSRKDGWTLMSTAGKNIQKEAFENLTTLKEKHGYKSLKVFILETGMFDIYEERTEKGGFRLLYKLKPDYAVDTGFPPSRE
ncbi:hypothetical protein LL240_11980 [Oceanimonas baumannii]|uniref:hypothetical protein n=1 Tax=Oceanimonas baumannii TaxID=129578 RepID=UPI001D18CC3B|nr:hypothetical protein [Oceanimonas baumannii]MCC4265165.1 hypothetical protein [Oceanimonas baumannii]